jgi:hypothetical protein
VAGWQQIAMGGGAVYVGSEPPPDHAVEEWFAAQTTQATETQPIGSSVGSFARAPPACQRGLVVRCGWLAGCPPNARCTECVSCRERRLPRYPHTCL